MKLHTLKPAEGSTKSVKELPEVKDQDVAVLQPEVTKVLNQDQVIQERLVLKEVKCLYKEEFPSLVLDLLTGLKQSLSI